MVKRIEDGDGPLGFTIDDVFTESLSKRYYH